MLSRICAIGLSLLIPANTALAQAATPTKQAPSAAPAEPETKPYDAKLMRLAQILGALSYMRHLCGETDEPQWRQKMQALLDAEGTTSGRKDRLAGAYNKGLQEYGRSYRTCTANAHTVIQRFLGEGETIAKAIENRYRAS